MTSEIAILYLDDDQVGDRLFQRALATQYLRRSAAVSLVIIHGAGEPAERLLESRGFVPEWSSGALRPASESEQELVERAAREAGRRIAGALTDAGISAVAVSASDRNLLSTDEDGRVRAARAHWLLELVQLDVVPVIALLGRVPETNAIRELDVASAILALADALDPEASSVVAVAVDASVEPTGARERKREVLSHVAAGGIDLRMTELPSIFGSDAV